MARRFGSPPTEHASRVKDYARRIMKVRRELTAELRKGNCTRALGLLTRLERESGSMHAERIGTGRGGRASGSARVGVAAWHAFQKRCRVSKR